MNTSVDTKHHGASLSEQWNVTWVGNNQNAQTSIKTLGEREPGNLSEQVEHVGVSNVAMFA